MTPMTISTSATEIAVRIEMRLAMRAKPTQRAATNHTDSMLIFPLVVAQDGEGEHFYRQLTQQLLASGHQIRLPLLLGYEGHFFGKL
jgi:hypothetical protein